MRLLIWMVENGSRRKLLSEFWTNVAVAWFVAAFISEGEWLTKLIYVVNIILSLLFAMFLKDYED